MSGHDSDARTGNASLVPPLPIRPAAGSRTPTTDDDTPSARRRYSEILTPRALSAAAAAAAAAAVAVPEPQPWYGSKRPMSSSPIALHHHLHTITLEPASAAIPPSTAPAPAAQSPTFYRRIPSFQALTRATSLEHLGTSHPHGGPAHGHGRPAIPVMCRMPSAGRSFADLADTLQVIPLYSPYIAPI